MDPHNVHQMQEDPSTIQEDIMKKILLQNIFSVRIIR